MGRWSVRGEVMEELDEHDWAFKNFLNEKVKSIVGGCVIGSRRRMERREFLVQSVLAILGLSACARAAPARLSGGAAGTSGAVAPAVCPARCGPRLTRLTAALRDLRERSPPDSHAHTCRLLACGSTPPDGLAVDVLDDQAGGGDARRGPARGRPLRCGSRPSRPP